jgi:hypothetical protein
MTSARNRYIPLGWWGLVGALLVAVAAQYTYGFLLAVFSAIVPSLLQAWSHGGVWQRVLYDAPLHLIVAVLAALTFRERRAFSAGLLSYIVLIVIWYGAFLVGRE